MEKILKACIDLAVGTVGLYRGDYLTAMSLPLGFIKIVGSKSATQKNIQNLVQDTLERATSEFEEIKEFKDIELEPLLSLIESQKFRINPNTLIEAGKKSKNGNIGEALAKSFYEVIEFDGHSDAQKSALRKIFNFCFTGQPPIYGPVLS